MGWNTTVIVLNDAIDMIKDDVDFGRNLYYAILELQRGKQVDIPARSSRGGIHCNAATAVETHHADDTAIVAVGQNCATELGRCYYTGFHGEEQGKLNILRQLADNMGYRLVKKSAKRN
jgi:hypothetical protein